MLKSLRRLLVLYRDHRKALVISQVLLLISASATIGVAGLNQRLIDDGIAQDDAQVITSTGIWMVVLALVAGFAMAATAAFAVFFSQGTAWWLRTQVYRKIQSFSFENFDQYRTGRLLVNLSSDVLNISNAVMFAVLMLLYAPFTLLIAIILALISTPSLTWMIAVVIAVVGALLFMIIPGLIRAYGERQRRLDDVNNTLQESLAGIQVVKAFAREELEVERFDQRADAMRRPAFQAAFRVAFLSPLLLGTAQILVALSIGIGSSSVFDGTIEVGQLVAFQQYLGLVVTPLVLIAIVVPTLLRGDESAQRIYEVLDAEPAIVDRSEVEGVDPANVQGAIAFEGVTFAFRRPNGELDPPVLEEIDLSIAPGERIGILGSTGAGKTALVNLISRFYEPTQGRVTLDGVDVRDYPLDQLHSLVGVALQQALLFEGDVRWNLKFANPEVDDDVMIAAAAASDSRGFITNLPEGWEAPVARRGDNFSGGQRQRLSMARALTAEPRVLVLDDSTSALDAATEARVQEAIPQFAQGLTTIYVAQRISAVIDLDRIVLLENGRIVGLGTHSELLATSSLYQEIYESQLGGGVTAGLDEEVVR